MRPAPAATAALLATALLLAGCAAPPPPPNTDDTPKSRRAPTPSPPAGGMVLARNDRLLIYQPRAGDTLRSIAARFLGSEDRYWMIGDHNGIARPEAGQPLVVPLKPLNPIGVAADHYQTVPILCYHRFGNGGGGKMTVSVASFAAQLDWLAANDWHVIPLSSLSTYLQGRQPLPKRSVVITIDDGYESVHRHAWPLLRKHGFPATLFVYTDFVGAGDALSWSQMKEMSASGLIDIQSHSKSHRNLIERIADEPDERYRQAIEQEIRIPRELLERRLAAPIRHYAYPFGDANETVLDALARQQVQLAVTVNPGGNAFFAQPLMLRRTMVYGDHDLEQFKARLQASRPIAAVP